MRTIRPVAVTISLAIREAGRRTGASTGGETHPSGTPRDLGTGAQPGDASGGY